MLENEETKEYGVKDLMPKEKTVEKKNPTVKSKSKKPVSKKKGKKKIKPIYWMIIVFVAIVALVMGYVWSISRNDGPVYGDRCAGMAEIKETAIKTTVDNMKANLDGVSDLSIQVECKTIEIKITMAEGQDGEAAAKATKTILKELDKNVGLPKSNEKKEYSDLLTAANKKDSTKYHVDITIKGVGEDYPIFGSKHPNSDKINFTYATPRDPDLVDKLHEQQAEDNKDE